MDTRTSLVDTFFELDDHNYTPSLKQPGGTLALSKSKLTISKDGPSLKKPKQQSPYLNEGSPSIVMPD